MIQTVPNFQNQLQNYQNAFNNKTWTKEKVDEILKTDTETGISAQPNMPVYIAYFTAWVDYEGNLNFRNDIYNLDEQLAKEIFSQQ